MTLRVKEICKEKGLQMQELADMLGITRITLTRNISGNPTISTLESIATALNVDITELFAKRGDFVAFVRDQGKIYTFDTIEALKEFTDAAHKVATNFRELGAVLEVKAKE